MKQLYQKDKESSHQRERLKRREKTHHGSRSVDPFELEKMPSFLNETMIGEEENNPGFSIVQLVFL
ncbi:hypothetical protein F2Q70_00044127 [Brassica cretica]|uniref:Uncharacterized protein n=1 Tax=Brassica cretica TaxID=69181 RepID=A0A8S9KMP5_BRACR|nr:hypothetical protein F2Q70_00044127 [Brassica cretica]